MRVSTGTGGSRNYNFIGRDNWSLQIIGDSPSGFVRPENLPRFFDPSIIYGTLSLDTLDTCSIV